MLIINQSMFICSNFSEVCTHFYIFEMANYSFCVIWKWCFVTLVRHYWMNNRVFILFYVNLWTAEEEELVNTVFSNAIDSLSEDDKDLPQVYIYVLFFYSLYTFNSSRVVCWWLVFLWVFKTDAVHLTCLYFLQTV